MNERERSRLQQLVDSSLTCLNADCRTAWFFYSAENRGLCPKCGCIGVEDPDGNEVASDEVEEAWKLFNPTVESRREWQAKREGGARRN